MFGSTACTVQPSLEELYKELKIRDCLDGWTPGYFVHRVIQQVKEQ